MGLRSANHVTRLFIMDTTNYEVKYCGKTYTITRNANGKFVMPEEIKKLKGSMGGAQFKPAVEVIIVAMKPMDQKTFTSQALANGHGITWLDDCRMPYATGDEPMGGINGVSGFVSGESHVTNTKGRFPANLLVSDDVLNDGKISKSSPFNMKRVNKTFVEEQYQQMNGVQYTPTGGYNDKGSYSRYFSLDSWANQFPFLIVPKASKKEKNAGCEKLEEKSNICYEQRKCNIRWEEIRV